MPNDIVSIIIRGGIEMANKPQAKLKFVRGQFGINWRALRKSTGKTVREFAEGIGLSYPTISKIENESETPTIDQINCYQEIFGVSLDYLVGATTNPSVELNEITKYTGLSLEAIEHLHSHVVKATPALNLTPEDAEHCVPLDFDLHTDFVNEFYNNFICWDNSDKLIEELFKLKRATSHLVKHLLSINSIDEIVDGYLRGLIIKSALVERDINKMLSTMFCMIDERDSKEYKEKMTSILSDIQNKTGIAEGADDDDLSLAHAHLDGKILSLDFDSEDVKNTLEMLSLIDADDNYLE